MEFAKELYPTQEEAIQAVLEHPEAIEAIKDYLQVLDTAYTTRICEEAAKTFAARIAFLFEREKNRAKDTTDEDAHAEERRGA